MRSVQVIAMELGLHTQKWRRGKKREREIFSKYNRLETLRKPKSQIHNNKMQQWEKKTNYLREKQQILPET